MKAPVLLAAGFAALCCMAVPAFAHGALIEGAVAPGIRVQAAYDSGEPMAGAQIIVYAPSSPMKPWLTGVADGEGRFSFVADPQDSGVWAVQARQAGHGAIFHVRTMPADAGGGAVPVAGSGLDPLQRTIAAAAVVWGFVGTALFFRRRRRNHAHS